MASLLHILNDDNVVEDLDSLQKTHDNFIFSSPDCPSSSDIAIQTLQALAHHTSLIKRERPLSEFEPSAKEHERRPGRRSPLKSTWDKSHPTTPSKHSPPPPSSPSTPFSRREYKKKELVIRPELMQMKQAKAAVKLGIPPSTFSKRWRESLPDRKWPYRYCIG